MEQPLRNGVPTATAPSFHLIDRQPIRPVSLLLAVAVAAGAAYAIAAGISHSSRARIAAAEASAARVPGSPPGSPPPADEKDDPNQVDTIVIGDAADAPVPARRGDHVSDVHATILIRLPRYGDQVGLIPDSPAGHLLYKWLAAFNQASYPALEQALPSAALASTAGVQMALRQQNGGFNLLSAKEVQPGILVFRLRDQTPAMMEVLGTLQVRPGSNPASIASFSLRAIPPAHPNVGAGVALTRH